MSWFIPKYNWDSVGFHPPTNPLSKLGARPFFFEDALRNPWAIVGLKPSGFRPLEKLLTLTALPQRNDLKLPGKKDISWGPLPGPRTVEFVSLFFSSGALNFWKMNRLLVHWHRGWGIPPRYLQLFSQLQKQNTWTLELLGHFWEAWIYSSDVFFLKKNPLGIDPFWGFQAFSDRFDLGIPLDR